MYSRGSKRDENKAADDDELRILRRLVVIRRDGAEEGISAALGRAVDGTAAIFIPPPPAPVGENAHTPWTWTAPTAVARAAAAHRMAGVDVDVEVEVEEEDPAAGMFSAAASC